MYERVNKNLSQDVKEISVSWDTLIVEGKKRIAEIQAAIDHFEKNKAKGEPFFGELKKQTERSR